VLKGHGIVYDDPQTFLNEFIGQSHVGILDALNARHGKSIPFETSEDAYTRNALALLPTHMKVFPESVAWVRGLSKTHKIAVASNGNRIMVVEELRAAGYLEFIPEAAIFTACDVDAPKPAPDLFLHAAAYLGVDPVDCVVLEDSAVGTAGGVAAGMRVVGYTGFSHDPAVSQQTLEKAGCFKVVNTLADAL
jgi:HAD superfamily hydrolase (TIGR01509 family)